MPRLRTAARGSRAWDLGPWAGPQDGHGVQEPSSPPFPFPCFLSLLHSQLKPSSCSGVRAQLGQVGGRLHWACFLSPEGACSCRPLPCQSQARVLPAHRAPLCPRPAEAEGPPCWRPGTSLNPHSASTSSLSLRQHIWPTVPLLRAEGAEPHPCRCFSGEYGFDPGLRASLLTPSYPGSWPSALCHSFFLQKTNLGLYLRSHVPSAVSCLSLPHSALPSSLYLNSWATSWGPLLPGSPLVSCQAFCKEKPLGERWKRTKKNNKFPLALG